MGYGFFHINSFSVLRKQRLTGVELCIFMGGECITMLFSPVINEKTAHYS